MKNPEKEIQRLREEIRKHERLYYVFDSPEISDAEFDGLMQRPEEVIRMRSDAFVEYCYAAAGIPITSSWALAFTQTSAPKTEDPEIRAKIEELLSNAEKVKDNPVKLDDALDMIRATQKDYLDKGGDISPETHDYILKASSKIRNFMSQNISFDGNHPDLKAKIEKLIAKVEMDKNKPLDLNNSIDELGKKLNYYRNHRIYISPEMLCNVTKRLIKIFNSIDDIDTNGANKIHIIETIGHSDNSSKAHEFFLTILDSGNPEYRQRALWSLNYPKGLYGDDIYDK
ncbi:MAG: hypothetical protein HY746_03450, partial [Elusimicrobia bacterium]|nr:hypothetical protein [Elusimicrobiota bacterium]